MNGRLGCLDDLREGLVIIYCAGGYSGLGPVEIPTYLRREVSQMQDLRIYLMGARQPQIFATQTVSAQDMAPLLARPNVSGTMP